MSDGSEFQVCEAATENARRANSVCVLAADSSRASEYRISVCSTFMCVLLVVSRYTDMRLS